MIKLTKNGLFPAPSEDAPMVPITSRHEMFVALGDIVEFDSDVTVRDIFRIFEPIKDFLSGYSTIDFDAYARELSVPVDWARKESCPIDHIEITHGATYWKDGNELNIHSDSCGVDSSIPVEDHGKWDEGSEHSTSRYWAVDAQPMNNIADLPVRLNKNFKIENGDDFTYIAEGWKREFTLLEALNALLYEISFFGGPEDRDEFLDMLGGRMEEIKNMTPEERETKLIPWSEVKKKLDDLLGGDENGGI